MAEKSWNWAIISTMNDTWQCLQETTKQCYHQPSKCLAMAAPGHHEQVIVKLGLSEAPQEWKDSWHAGWSGPGQYASNPKTESNKWLWPNGKNQSRPKWWQRYKQQEITCKKQTTVIETMVSNMVMDLKNPINHCFLVAWKCSRSLETTAKNGTRPSKEHGNSW